MVIEGKIWKFGRDIDTDQIIPAKYLNITRPKDLSRHLLEGVNPHFFSKVKPGDIIVAEENFGSGSSREHAPLAIKGSGVAAVVAKSFARIFFRNAINVGLPIFESSEAATYAKTGDQIRVDTAKGEITNLALNKTFKFSAYPEFIQDIIKAGGLIAYAKTKVKKAGIRNPELGTRRGQ